MLQGLTVILDDYNSTLPLTPTKQDIAWADSSQGTSTATGATMDVHHENVHAWLRGITKLYYEYYQVQVFGGIKGNLNSAVKSVLPRQEYLTGQRGHYNEQGPQDKIVPLSRAARAAAFHDWRMAVFNTSIYAGTLWRTTLP